MSNANTARSISEIAEIQSPKHQIHLPEGDLVKLLKSVEIERTEDGIKTEIPLEIAEIFHSNPDHEEVRGELTSAIESKTKKDTDDRQKAVAGFYAVMDYFRSDNEATVYDFAEEKAKRNPKKPENNTPIPAHEKASSLYYDEDFETLSKDYSKELFKPDFVNKMVNHFTKQHPELVFVETESGKTVVNEDTVENIVKVIEDAGDNVSLSNRKAIKEWCTYAAKSENDLFERYRVQVIAGLIASEKLDFNQTIEILCEINAKFENQQAPAVSIIGLIHGLEARLDGVDSSVLEKIKTQVYETNPDDTDDSAKPGKRNGVKASESQKRNLLRLTQGAMSEHVANLSPKLHEYIELL